MGQAWHTISVPLGPRTYDIVIGSGILDGLLRLLASRVSTSHYIVITDENVYPRLGGRVKQLLSASAARVDLLVVPPGEATKSIEWAEKLWQSLVDFRTDRTSCIVALGGGVVGDLAGFVAATFARGIPYIQIPTTLLAQVDSSVGGKVAVNLPAAKNIIGSFWQPLLVAIDVEFLNTLPEREFRSGLAEVVKYGVAMDAHFFEDLELSVSSIEAREPEVLTRIVSRSCALKSDAVASDELDTTGRRAILNYGHTLAHALESTMGYVKLLHGEAVAIGMNFAAYLARELGRVDGAFVDRQADLLHRLGLPTAIEQLRPAELWQAMQRDKKVEHGKLKFVLPRSMGIAEVVDGVEAATVERVLRLIQ
jgi:3-dehydroquinate synthase